MIKRQLLSTPLSGLLASHAFSQLLVVVFMAVYAYVFSAQTMSLLGVVLSAGSLLWSFSQLRLDIAQFKARDEKRRSDLFQAGLASHVFFSSVSVVVLYGFELIPGWAFVWVWLILLGMGYQQMGISWLAAGGRYRPQNGLRLSSMAIAYPGGIAAYPFWGDWAPLLTLALGYLGPAIWFSFRKELPVPRLSSHWWRLVGRSGAVEWYMVWGNVLVALADHGFILFIAASADAATSAAVFLAMRVCATPLSLIQAPLSQYHYRKFQDLHENRQLHNGVYMDIWRRWLLPALLIFVPIVCFGPSIFTLILGEAWTFAGQTAAIIAPLYFVRFLNNPTSMGFYIIGKSAVFFYFTVVLALVLPLAYLLAAVGLALPQLLMFYVTYLILVYMAYNLTMLTLTSQHTT